MVAYGAKIRKQFLKSLPALAKLIKAVQTVAKERGYLKALDGARLNVRSAHSALNTLFQSAGALIMKKALVIADIALQKHYTPGKDYEYVLNIHDEIDCEVMRPEIAEHVGQVLRQSIIDAGVYYKFKCPLDGEAKIGKTWRDIH